MNKFIYVLVDTNDGDYVADLTEVKNESDIDVIKRIWNAINENDSEGYGRGEVFDGDISYLNEQFTKEELGIFEKYMPCCEFGFHTIWEISLITGNKEEL